MFPSFSRPCLSTFSAFSPIARKVNLNLIKNHGFLSGRTIKVIDRNFVTKQKLQALSGKELNDVRDNIPKIKIINLRKIDKVVVKCYLASVAVTVSLIVFGIIQERNFFEKVDKGEFLTKDETIKVIHCLKQELIGPFLKTESTVDNPLKINPESIYSTVFSDARNRGIKFQNSKHEYINISTEEQSAEYQKFILGEKVTGRESSLENLLKNYFVKPSEMQIKFKRIHQIINENKLGICNDHSLANGKLKDLDLPYALIAFRQGEISKNDFLYFCIGSINLERGYDTTWTHYPKEINDIEFSQATKALIRNRYQTKASAIKNITESLRNFTELS